MPIMRIDFASNNFKGYKNIISNDICGTNARLLFISAQLNDENEADLLNYKNIKKGMLLPKKDIDNDVINIIYAHKYGGRPQMFLDDKILYWGKELKQLQNMVPKIMPESEYKNIETAHMRAYTLMASLSKRMMNDNFSHQDREFKKSINQFMKIFTLFTRDNDAAFQLLDLSLRKQEPFQKVARLINETIVKTMSHFF